MNGPRSIRNSDTDMNLMMKIIEDLTPLNRVFCSRDYDKAINYLKEILPFKVISFFNSEELNGWVIPPKWDVKEAKIFKDGSVIYDGMSNPLCVIALSKGFRGRVELEQLKEHLFFDHRCAEAIPYHFRQEYRSWERDWGFCVTKKFYDSLMPGDYQVVIDTEESEGVLKVLEFTHQGTLSNTIVFAAHLDHPGMANDGLSGCAVGVELMRRLKEKKTKFTYTLCLHQEVMGAEYYLGTMVDERRRTIMEGVFLEMLGSRTQLALQKSPEANTNIEIALPNVMRDLNKDYRQAPYGDIVVNGEYIWAAYGIQLASLSRFPYPEYHSDRDNMSIISVDALDEAVDVLLRAIELFESSPVLFKRFRGNICVSNPKYDLYVDQGQTAFGSSNEDDEVKKMRYLMELIPSLHRPVSIRVLAERVGLHEEVVFHYIQKWEEKGLLDIK